jgi:LCP family protein required for cell wall assembly
MTVRFKPGYRLIGLAAALALGGLVALARLWGCADAEQEGAGRLDLGFEEGESIVLEDVPDEGDAFAEAPDAGLPIASPVDYLGSGVDTEYILLLGFDDWRRLPGRTDSIMIVAARHDSGDLGVISVPRDLWVYIPGYEPGRINKVFRVGDKLYGKGGGHRLIKKVVEREFGIEISYTAAVDFKGFEAIVDSLGGIDIDIECPIKDNFISPKSETGYEQLHLASGRHRVDGRTALLFARSRHGRTDLDRARRQQTVLLGLKQRLTRLDALPRLPFLWSELTEYVSTDVDLAGAFRLAKLASTAGPGMVHGMVLQPPAVYSFRTPDGKAVLRLDRAELQKAVDELFLAPAPGYRGKPVCPSVNAALNWREKARKYREKKKAAKLARLADAGVEAELEPVDLEASPY